MDAKAFAALKKTLTAKFGRAPEQADLLMIEESLWPLVAPIDTLQEDPENERLHPERNMEAIASSLANFRQQKPCVADQQGQVIAGNGMLVAARALGWEWLASATSTLEGSARTGYRIADNRTNELSEWDYELLSGTFKGLESEGFNLDLTGFADFEREPFMQAKWAPPPLDDGSQPPIEKGKSVGFSPEEWTAVAEAIRVYREAQKDERKDAAVVASICSAWTTQAAKPEA